MAYGVIAGQSDIGTSEWNKVATNSLYDEWHLIVDGGTFVKLVGKAEATLVGPVSSNEITTNIHNTITNVTLPPKQTVNNVTRAKKHSSNNNLLYIINVEVSTDSKVIITLTVLNIGTDKVNYNIKDITDGQLLIEYFVPFT